MFVASLFASIIPCVVLLAIFMLAPRLEWAAEARLAVFPTAAINSTDTATPTGVFQTQSFFQGPRARPSAGLRKHVGMVVTMQFIAPVDATAECDVQLPRPDPAAVTQRTYLRTYEEAIIAVNWKTARACGLRTLSQLFPLARKLIQALPAAGSPPASAVVINLWLRYTGTQGNPNYEPYMARALGVSDAVPTDDLDIYLVACDDYKALSEAKWAAKYDFDGVRPIFVLEQEAGPWNDVFQSWWFLTATYLFVAINCAVILYALYLASLAIRDYEFKPNLRNAIFVVGLIGLLLYTACLPMRIFTRSEKILEAVASWFITIAFHALLYLWSIFLRQITHGVELRLIFAFQSLVAFGGLTATLTFIVNLLQSTMDPTPTTRLVAKVVSILTPATQIVIAMTFLYYALKFQSRRNASAMLSSSNYQALTRLSYVGLIAFVGYFLVAVCNLPLVTVRLTRPPLLAAIVIIRSFSASLRGIAVLAVMGVRSPRRDAQSLSKNSSTTSLASTLVVSKRSMV